MVESTPSPGSPYPGEKETAAVILLRTSQDEAPARPTGVPVPPPRPLADAGRGVPSDPGSPPAERMLREKVASFGPAIPGFERERMSASAPRDPKGRRKLEPMRGST